MSRTSDSLNIMQHVKAQPLKTLRAASLLLCVATLGLWVRSYFRTDWLTYGSVVDSELRQIEVAAGSDCGVMYLERSSFQLSRPAGWTNYQVGLDAGSGHGGRFDRLAGAKDHGFYFLGFSFLDFGVEYVPTAHNWDWKLGGFLMSIPYWPLMLVFAIMPTRWMFSERRRRARLHANLCTTCGYDLRETSAVCPECGTMSSKSGGDNLVPKESSDEPVHGV